MIDDSLLELLESGVLTDLGPPLLKHIPVEVASDHVLTVEQLQSDLLKS